VDFFHEYAGRSVGLQPRRQHLPRAGSEPTTRPYPTAIKHTAKRYFK
jgi:hypothetical protein